MSPDLFKILHLVGVIFLFTGLGGFLAFDDKNVVQAKFAVYLHGVGLLLLFLSGFGMQGLLKIGFPGWLLVKIVLWLALGGLLVLAKRGVIKIRMVIIIGIFLGCVAAYLGHANSVVP